MDISQWDCMWLSYIIYVRRYMEEVTASINVDDCVRYRFMTILPECILSSGLAYIKDPLVRLFRQYCRLATLGHQPKQCWLQCNMCCLLTTFLCETIFVSADQECACTKRNRSEWGSSSTSDPLLTEYTHSYSFAYWHVSCIRIVCIGRSDASTYLLVNGSLPPDCLYYFPSALDNSYSVLGTGCIAMP